jgi:hypothetical protein
MGYLRQMKTLYPPVEWAERAAMPEETVGKEPNIIRKLGQLVRQGQVAVVVQAGIMATAPDVVVAYLEVVIIMVVEEVPQRWVSQVEVAQMAQMAMLVCPAVW